MKIQQAPTNVSFPLRKLPGPVAPLTVTPDEVVAGKGEDSPPPNTREVRIGRFVKSLTRESLEHLRYLSTMWAFNMVGTTAGLIAATPIGVHFAHDNAAVVGGVAIGGGIATGAAAALAGYGLERHASKKRAAHKDEPTTTSTKGAETLVTLASALRAMPKFIYPTVVGTPAEEKAIYDALDKLPLKDVTASQVMHVMPNLTDTGISGMSQPGLTHTRILLDKDYINDSRAEGLVHHEQGHAVDYSGGYGLLGSLNWRGPFGHAPYVSNYASGNRYEDWAESYEAYHRDPVGFTRDFPAKAHIIQQAERTTPGEHMMDNPQVREAGRNIGHALGQVPYLRTGLETGLSLLSPIQLHRGANALEKGLINDDDALKLRGKMSLITGVLMGLPGGAPLATVASAMNLGFQFSTGNDPKKLKEANALASKFMSVATGPVGMASVAIGQELSKAGVDLSKIDYTPDDFDAPVKPGKMLEGLLCTVGGGVAGSLAGAYLGGALGAGVGASMSAFWGRIGGGLLGLGAYGAYRALKSEHHDPNPYDLTRGDKVFLTKIVGGAVAGAALGTLGGVTGGRALGALIGNAFLPGSETWTANIGGWAGALLGSYALGKAGAVAGRKLTEKDVPEA
ncbi:hypothetical protein JST97_30595 [bacterium]|nr:hypothetical protein [bacterium]